MIVVFETDTKSVFRESGFVILALGPILNLKFPQKVNIRTIHTLPIIPQNTTNVIKSPKTG